MKQFIKSMKNVKIDKYNIKNEIKILHTFLEKKINEADYLISNIKKALKLL